MVLIWPLCMLETVVHDEGQAHLLWMLITWLHISGRFLIWTGISQTWTFLAAAYIIIVPLFEEVKEVYTQYTKKTDEKTEKMKTDGITAVSPYVDWDCWIVIKICKYVVISRALSYLTFIYKEHLHYNYMSVVYWHNPTYKPNQSDFPWEYWIFLYVKYEVLSCKDNYFVKQNSSLSKWKYSSYSLYLNVFKTDVM